MKVRGENPKTPGEGTNILGSWRFIYSLAKGAAPKQFWMDLLAEPLGFLTTVILGYWFKLITDCAVRSDGVGALFGALGFAVTVGLLFLLQGVGLRLRMGLNEQVRVSVERDLANCVGSSPDLTLFESPEMMTRLEMIRSHQDLLAKGPGLIVVGVGHVARLIVTALILGAVHPILILLPIFGSAPAAAAAINERRLRRAAESSGEFQRLARLLIHQYTNSATGKEVRVYGVQAALESRYLEACDRAGYIVDSAGLKAAALNVSGWIVFGLGFSLALVLTTSMALRGQATPGQLVMAVYLTAMVSGHVQGLTWAITQHALLLRIVTYFLQVKSYVLAMAEESNTRQARSLSEDSRCTRYSGSEGIALENVHFSYPHCERSALSGINLHFAPGSVVALLGENGAGKSTLVKLLLGLYAPTRGRILVGGIDLASMSPDKWRLQCSAAFQDFCRFEIPLRDAVGIGDLARSNSEPTIRQALERAGADGLSDEFAQGLATPLGSTWGGVELSVGQWQKVAIARAMMRSKPQLLILDEPTASLDAEAEYELFHRYAKMARNGALGGAITILITHRLSTVRMADKIVLVESGQIREAGTHRQLVDRQGAYAELCRIQAERYGPKASSAVSLR